LVAEQITPFVIIEAQYARSLEFQKRAAAEDIILETRTLETAATGMPTVRAARL
jgi:hypothetical protein